ncbi:response regulator transcription factor [Solimonas sp. K1W22B-7]|uniref:response regulator transcription factor n=1 Tax=Solimonas sp. K1W22B-7 TaxID=2303331 RepID=UPI0013C4E85A|nr:LuxR C-terminal-related transcriptional regulator [Solimonas sp. K1W22B-7]
MDALRHIPAQPTRRATQALTEREIDILELAGRGLSVKGVAKALGITPGTVSWHLKNSYQKLGAASREEALQKARAEKLIEAVAICQVCACAMASRTGVPSGAGFLRR